MTYTEIAPENHQSSLAETTDESVLNSENTHDPAERHFTGGFRAATDDPHGDWLLFEAWRVGLT